MSCTYCRREHTSAKCNVITDVQARKAILRNKGKCFGCLKSGHVIRNCQSRMECWRCKRRHHISICDAENRAPPPPNNEQQSTQFRNDVSHGQGNTNFTATITTSVKSTTLLQTARGILCSKFYNENIRILSDNCSQRSFVSKNLCRKT